MTDDEIREALAAQEHDRWAGWMRYLFSRCVVGQSGALIPEIWMKRWQRQIDTPYAELTEREKDSDRKEADKTLVLLAALKEKPLASRAALEAENERLRAKLKDARADVQLLVEAEAAAMALVLNHEGHIERLLAALAKWEVQWDDHCRRHDETTASALDAAKRQRWAAEADADSFNHVIYECHEALVEAMPDWLSMDGHPVAGIIALARERDEARAQLEQLAALRPTAPIEND